MSEPTDESTAEQDLFELDLSEPLENNNRKAVRYVRQDISALLLTKSLFGSTKNNLVQLIDISSRGALIACSNKLTVKNKVNLQLVFKDGKKFLIPATVIHINGLGQKQYGLKFDNFNHELGDYLLSSQSDLVFK